MVVVAVAARATCVAAMGTARSACDCRVHRNAAQTVTGEMVSAATG